MKIRFLNFDIFKLRENYLNYKMSIIKVTNVS